MKTCKLLAMVMMIVAGSALAFGQPTADVPGASNTGLPSNGVFSGSSFDNVQINNGNLHIEIPVTAQAGRGETVTYKYVYESKGWSFHPEINIHPPQGPVGVIVAGATDRFKFTGGPAKYRATFNGLGSEVCGTSPGSDIPVYVSHFGNYTLIEQDGTKHPFPGTFDLAPAGGCASTPPGTTLYSTDGSGWIMHIGFSNIGGSNLFPVNAIRKDGAVISFLANSSGSQASAVDRNGNILSGATDTLGRPFPAPGSYYDSNGNLQSWQITSAPVPVATALCGFYHVFPPKCVEFKSNLSRPTVIQLPDGLTYQFTYAQNDYGEPTSVILPTGAQISWTWGNVDSSGPKVISRTVTIGGQSFIWHYSYGYSGNQSLWVNTITDPMGNETDYTCTYLHVDPHGSDVGGDPGCTPVKVHR